jgi:hypothetical protein
MVDPDQKKSFLSPALRAFFQRRLLELAGLLVILIGLALTAMFFSPGRFDPSLSAYSDGADPKLVWAFWCGRYGRVAHSCGDSQPVRHPAAGILGIPYAAQA